MAADILGVGENRVKFQPSEQDSVEEAITRNDIRNLIESGAIQKRPQEGNSKARSKQNKKQKQKGRKKGQGSRSGTKNARKDSKTKWMEGIRSIRSRLKQMKENGTVDRETYRDLYNKAKGGYFRDTKHLETYVQEVTE